MKLHDAFACAPLHAPRSATRGLGRIAWTAPFGALCVAACSQSPAQDLAGSFFPAWMLCAGIGVAAAVVVHVVLAALRLNKYVVMPPLAFLSIAVAVTLFTWLLRFGQ